MWPILATIPTFTSLKLALFLFIFCAEGFKFNLEFLGLGVHGNKGSVRRFLQGSVMSFLQVKIPHAEWTTNWFGSIRSNVIVEHPWCMSSLKLQIPVLG